MIQGLVRGWWRWATSKQVSKNGCMLIPSGVGAMWLANNSNIYIDIVCIAILMTLGTTGANKWS